MVEKMTTSGNQVHRKTIVPFRAGDGLQLNLHHLEGSLPPTRRPVLLVHGAGVRADIFQAPVQTTIVDALLEEGYDVWLENWRASIDVPSNYWTLDQAALYDHPEAVKTVLQQTGAEKISAIIHCQGSTSFTMSALAGLVPAVDTIISNAVSLHPVVPTWSRLKLNYLVPMTGLFIDHLDPSWGQKAPGIMPKVVSAIARSTHHECDNTVCKLVSFAYGAGAPALWSHENLSQETHDWLRNEFGFVPLRFHRQMAACVKRGHLVSVEKFSELPTDFALERVKTDSRFAFFAGENNLCFLAESQRRSFNYFNELNPRVHSLHVIPGYGHLDMFMGSNASRDVFPAMLRELDKSSSC